MGHRARLVAPASVKQHHGRSGSAAWGWGVERGKHLELESLRARSECRELCLRMRASSSLYFACTERTISGTAGRQEATHRASAPKHATSPASQTRATSVANGHN